MLLLRHASAGARLAEPSLDAARPLDVFGRAAAHMLEETLRGASVDRIVSSPLARCVETVQALARSQDLEIELRVELSPGASRAEIVGLLGELPASAVVCTHREVFEELFAGAVECEKGAGWTLERDGGDWRAVEYVPAPDLAGILRAAAIA